jgi:hypothetical protein
MVSTLGVLPCLETTFEDIVTRNKHRVMNSVDTIAVQSLCYTSASTVITLLVTPSALSLTGRLQDAYRTLTGRLQDAYRTLTSTPARIHKP